jgi:rhodanese-related sulfurtransferase
LACEEPGFEIVLGSLAAAAERGLEVIDIRTAEEVAARPAGARHIPMANLLADPTLLAPAPLELSLLEPAPLELSPLELSPLEPAPLELSPLELSPLELSLLEPALLEPALLEPAQLEPAQLEPARQVLLVCATGKRSLAAAQQLRKRGIAAHSLAGGLQNLER